MTVAEVTTSLKSITVLQLKLDLSDAQRDEVERVSVLCRRGRNHAVEDWLLRMRGKPESAKQAGKGRSLDKDGNAKEKSESTKLYHAVSEAAPQINSQIRSAIAGAINSYLSAKVDWRRRATNGDGRPMKRRDAILKYEDRPPFSTCDEIPIPCKECVFTFVEQPELCIRLLVGGERQCFRLHFGKMPAGLKRILRRVASGELKLADSRCVKRGDEWYWHLPVAFVAEQRGDREAVLEPKVVLGEQSSGQSDRPFVVTTPDRTWHVGDGRYLLAQLARLIALRKQIGWRYRGRNGAGHGRAKIDEAVRRRRKQQQDITTEVRRRAIADVVRQCERDGCGLLTYREPTGPAKTKCWFEKNGVEWDWTRFAGDLKNACARKGIAVQVAKLKIAEVLK